MNRSRLVLVMLLACALGVAGCGDDGGSPIDTDAGGSGTDAGSPVDAGAMRDAFVPADASGIPDAGTRDAGNAHDAGGLPDAHGLPDAAASDSGVVPRIDSGTSSDAGATDAGTSSIEVVDLGSTGSASSFTRTATLVGASSAQSGTCGGTLGHERVFRLTATSAATWYTSVSASGFTPVVYIRQESTGAEIGCAVNPGEFDFGRELTAGESYLFFVDATTDATASFVLTIQQT